MPVACEKPAVVNGFISFHVATKGVIFHKGLSRYFTFGNRRIFHLIIVPSFLAVRYRGTRDIQSVSLVPLFTGKIVLCVVGL